MMPEQDERELREAFHRLHSEHSRNAPQFDDMWQAGVRTVSRRNRSRQTTWIVMAAVTAVVGMAIVYRSIRPHQFATSRQPELTEWKAPTDFLLQTPSRALLTETPRIPAPGLALPIQAPPQRQEKKP